MTLSPAAKEAAIRVPFGGLDADYREKRTAIDAAVARVLARGRFILGEEVAAFEQEFAEYLGVRAVIGCASGTEAIALALAAAGAKPKDEVLLPANTCVPTLAGVRMAGATPRLADVEPDTLTLSGATAEAALTPAVRFLLPVHLYGGPSDLGALGELARARGLTLLEDCAQSHGASYEGRGTGSFGLAAAFSFYPTKNLGAYGDAGAVATDDADLARELRRLRQYGWSRRDYSEREGWNSRLDEIQAAILRAKLPSLESDNARRQRIAARYNEAFAALPLRLLDEAAGARASYHLYPVRTRRRDALRGHLRMRGIETGIHYPLPLHLQPAYAFLGHRPGDFPVSEEASETILSLPLYPTLADGQVERVIGAVREFFASE